MSVFRLKRVVPGAAVLATLVLGAVRAEAVPFVYTGTTIDDPTFNRPALSGRLSPVGTAVPHDVLAFTVDDRHVQLRQHHDHHAEVRQFSRPVRE
jgi:hypothetical protein